MDYKVRYLPKKIKELKTSDEKVMLTGQVINSTQNSLVLSDDSGKMEIFSEEQFENGKTVRAFCSLVDSELKLDFFQDFSNSDLNLFKRVGQLYKKVGI